MNVMASDFSASSSSLEILHTALKSMAVQYVIDAVRSILSGTGSKGRKLSPPGQIL